MAAFHIFPTARGWWRQFYITSLFSKETSQVLKTCEVCQNTNATQMSGVVVYVPCSKAVLMMGLTATHAVSTI